MNIPKVLLVDDQPNLLNSFRRQLRTDFEISVATRGADALALLKEDKSFAVVVSDMTMPEMNGVEFLRQARLASPDTTRIMLTGNVDQQTAVTAVNETAIFRFLSKPCSPDQLQEALNEGYRFHKAIVAEREVLERTLTGSVKFLTDLLNLLEPQTIGGADLRQLIRDVCARLDLTESWDIEVAALLAPIGYALLPASTRTSLKSGTPLSEEEQRLLTQIPETASSLMRNIPRMESVAEIILYSEKNFDGSGFPHNPVRGDAIPLGSRILKAFYTVRDLSPNLTIDNGVLEALAARRNELDPRVLKTVVLALNGLAPDPQNALPTLRRLRVSELVPSQILRADARRPDGMLLLRRGVVLSAQHIAQLENHARSGGLREPLIVEHSNTENTSA